MTRFTIPNSSVVVCTVSIYSDCEFWSMMENFKQMYLFANGAFVLFTPGNCSPEGFNITA